MDDAKRRRLEAAITPTSATKRDVADDREDYPLKPCDFGRWLKFDSMSIGQACFVLMGHEPPSLQALHFQPSSSALVGPWITYPPGYTDLLKSLYLSIQNESVSAYPVQESMGITMHVPWVGLTKWAQSKGYDLPQELVALVNNAAPAQELSTTAPVVTANAGGEKLAVPNWQMRLPPERLPGYRWPLYQYLEAVQKDGKPRPTAHDVLLAWRISPPEDLSVSGVGHRMELHYRIKTGTLKTADLKTVQAAIEKLILSI